MRRTLAVCGRVVLCASLAVAAAQAADWPQWRGPARDGISKEQGMRGDWEASPPKLLWELDGMGGGYASVAVVGDRYPGLDVVGYESGSMLDAARGAGFTAIGPLRIWIRS